tara:strand:+ start:1005 stop:1598 length:594 start_codon:yes stop_codon:yes gene_type:complete
MKIIFITGPSGSGKTTVSKYISKNLNNSYVLSTDNYYKTGIISKVFSIFIRSYFDLIVSHKKHLIKKDIDYILKNNSVYHYYKYDFINKVTEKKIKKVSNIKNLIVEGIFTLELTDFFSENKYFLIRLKEKKNICRKRISNRDSIERGKINNLNFNEFNDAWKIYHEKENRYKSKLRKGITIKNNIDLKLLIKKLTK